MVWARTKLSIWDFVFEPTKQIKFEYIGKNPDKFYAKIQEAIRTVLAVPEAYIQEKEYKWEKRGETENFFVSIEATKLFDIFSYLTVELDFKGFSISGEGKAAVVLKPRLITEYPQDTYWQQSLFYEMLRRAWHKAFYHKKRMEYLRISKEFVLEIERKLKEFGEELRR